MAIRLSWFWFTATFLFGAVMVLLSFFLKASMMSRGGGEGLSGINFLVILLMAAFLIVGMSSISIGWHRFVLREEVPENFYILRGEWPVGGYIWASLKIIAVMFLVIISLMVIFIILSKQVQSSFMPRGMGPVDQGNAPGSSWFLSLLRIVMTIFATWIFLRLGAVLPAMAVGEKLSLRASFRLTMAISGPLFITALIIYFFQFAPTTAQFLLETILGSKTFLTKFLLLLIYLTFYWFYFFISFGVLTVIYGHLEENRPI